MEVTIKDVAKKSGVSITTISKYINGGNVRGNNKQAIESAIEELGYFPNKAARGLRNSKTFTIGFILDEMDNQYISLLVGNVEKYLKAAGYSLMICCHKGEVDAEKKCAEFLCQRHVDGILVSPAKENFDALETVRAYGIPIVAVDRMPSRECDSVTSNAASGAYKAVEYLALQGHRKIGVIAGEDTNVTAVERLKGYRRVLEDYGIPYNEKYIYHGDFKFDSGYAGVETLWKLEERPTAIFVCNYNTTLGAMTAVRNLDIHVPQQLSIICFDDLEYSLISNPKLTAVRQPVEKLAKNAVKILLKRIGGNYEDFPEKQKIQMTLHVRDSVAKNRDRGYV